MGNPPGDASDDVATLLRRSGAREEVGGSYRLEVIRGPDAGRVLEVDGQQPGRTLVGKGPACHLRLNDPHVSRRHLALDSTAQGLRITDLGSTNGTFVNDVAVLDGYLHDGQIVRLGETELRLEHVSASAPLPEGTNFGRILGVSAAMRRLYPLCERLAASDVPIVIEGESGTGKETLAEAIHEVGPRGAGPFVVFECPSVPAEAVESALFGEGSSEGLLEQAGGGTLVVDEIGDLPLTVQGQLLRAIERSQVQRRGGREVRSVDVRLIATTRRDLDREVQAGRFREDLLFKLAVARIELPPLRMRKEDIAPLARHFWRQQGGGKQAIPEALLTSFEDYEWPGNVRELQSAVARHLALGPLAGAAASNARRSTPAPSAATDFMEQVLAENLALPVARQRVTDEFLRRYVERVLARHGGNVLRAAAASGIARRYFYVIRSRQPKPPAGKS